MRCASDFRHPDNADPKPPSFGRPHIRERRGRVQGGEEDHQALHDPHQKIEVDSKFSFKMSLF